MRRTHKYRAQRAELDGYTFASKREMRRYAELKLLEKAGQISGLRMQPRYVLIEPFEYRGEKVRGMSYVADFEYQENGTTVVEDAKGFRTDVYAIKLKLFKFKYPELEHRET